MLLMRKKTLYVTTRECDVFGMTAATTARIEPGSCASCRFLTVSFRGPFVTLSFSLTSTTVAWPAAGSGNVTTAECRAFAVCAPAVVATIPPRRRNAMRMKCLPRILRA
jgi:hypothetical protein